MVDCIRRGEPGALRIYRTCFVECSVEMEHPGVLKKTRRLQTSEPANPFKAKLQNPKLT
jgi:hypothetical protein